MLKLNSNFNALYYVLIFKIIFSESADGQTIQMKQKKAKLSVEHECNICNLKFKSSQRLKNHKATHTEDKKYNCEFCASSFILARYLNDHLRRSHGNLKPFRCRFDSCSMRFKKKSDLNEHEDSSHKAVDYSCNFCFKILQSKATYKVHENNCSMNPENLDKVKSKTCKSCKAEFNTKKELNDHFSKEHEPKPEQLPGNFECEYCSKHFRSYDILMQHRQIHLEEKKFCCTACDRTFTLRRYLKDHLRRFHKLKNTYICKICDMVFLSSNEFELHKITHNLIKNEDKSAEVVDIIESSNDEFEMDAEIEPEKEEDLEEHQGAEYVIEEDSNTCTVFNRNKNQTSPPPLRPLSNLWTAPIQQIVQVEEAYFEINEDPLGIQSTSYENIEETNFEEESSNKKPRKIKKIKHKDEEIRKCHLCLRQFSLSRYLNDHLRRTHGSEKPFDCTICFDSFSTASELKTHSTTHEESTNFACNYCIKKFLTLELQKQHEENCKAR